MNIGLQWAIMYVCSLVWVTHYGFIMSVWLIFGSLTAKIKLQSRVVFYDFFGYKLRVTDVCAGWMGKMLTSDGAWGGTADDWCRGGDLFLQLQMTSSAQNGSTRIQDTLASLLSGRSGNALSIFIYVDGVCGTGSRSGRADALAAVMVLTLCISEVSCSSVGEAVALSVSVPLTGEFRLT